MTTTTISPPRRERNGRKQRKTTQEKLNEMAERDRLKIVGTVIRQPHRIDFPDPESSIIGCAVGRFVIRHKMAVEIVSAADVYAQAKRKWLAVKGAPMETRLGGTGADVDEATVAKWRDTFRSIETAVASVVGMNALSLIEGAAIRDMDIPENHHLAQVKRGFVEMAYAAGKLARPRAP